ncbi:alpha/beta hydrolase [Saccharopolyspora hirsuta]|uniref:Alpha/beta hydrolase n=1 Tax=Saccharopolyspora hirsuta TaxID=1837 RepID=A0A5M7BC77_SACHI|nr:alpha/beta hydrolase [Saccharopolyspora hirsuta]KAA5824951.1 alpha/beta hydrolase [Saccharopolyspora hirsuta]
MKRSFALGLAGAAVLASTAVAGMTAQAAPGLQFGPCPEDVSKPYPQLQCAELQVPLDYRDPGGERLTLLVSKQPARKPEARRGSLLINPGGPGGPGVGFAGALAPKLPAAVLDSYDLIGFDTRNTAHSTPITCVDPATYWKTPLPDPDSPQTREQNWQRAQQYADGCQQRAGKYLPHLTTPNNARDMDRVREALGEEKISYLGYSYGTYLGAVYGQLFPERVDRMLLDSVVNPDTSEIWYRNNLNQDIAAQERLGMYFDWIARHDQVFHLGTERAQVQAAWDGVQAELRKAPRGNLGPAEFIDITFNALYGESTWQELAEGLADFRLRNDDRKLVGQVEPKDEVAENGNAIYNAVECVDAPWPTRRAEWERDSERLAADYPLAAWYNSWTVAPCRFWHAPAQEPLKITGEGLPPVLLVNSEHDVATPYRGAEEMHRSLPSSVLVTERDAGKHGVWAVAGNAEIDRIGTDYLVNGVLPPEDVAVPGHPEPDPAAPSQAAPKTLDLR